MLNCWIHRMSGRYTPNSAWRSPLLIECIDPLRKHSNIKEFCLYKMHWPTSKHAQRPYVALFFQQFVWCLSDGCCLCLCLVPMAKPTSGRRNTHEKKQKYSDIIKHKHSTCVEPQNRQSMACVYSRNWCFTECIDPLKYDPLLKEQTFYKLYWSSAPKPSFLWWTPSLGL